MHAGPRIMSDVLSARDPSSITRWCMLAGARWQALGKLDTACWFLILISL